MYDKDFSNVDSSSSIKPLFCRDLFKAVSHSTSILPRSYGHLEPGGLPLVLLGVTSSLFCLMNTTHIYNKSIHLYFTSDRPVKVSITRLSLGETYSLKFPALLYNGSTGLKK